MWITVVFLYRSLEFSIPHKNAFNFTGSSIMHAIFELVVGMYIVQNVYIYIDYFGSYLIKMES